MLMVSFSALSPLSLPSLPGRLAPSFVREAIRHRQNRLFPFPEFVKSSLYFFFSLYFLLQALRQMVLSAVFDYNKVEEKTVFPPLPPSSFSSLFRADDIRFAVRLSLSFSSRSRIYIFFLYGIFPSKGYEEETFPLFSCRA